MDKWRKLSRTGRMGFKTVNRKRKIATKNYRKDLSMSYLKGAVIMPHPPLIIPDIGGSDLKKVKDTLAGMKAASNFIAAKKPDTLIFITPHGSAYKDASTILTNDELAGDFARFGHSQIVLEAANNQTLVKKVVELAEEEGVPLVGYDVAGSSLDWGVTVPLYYIQAAGWTGSIVVISFGLLSPEELERSGQVLGQALDALKIDAMVVASGDLSHRLKEDGPYDFHPSGPVFDKKVRELIENNDMEGFLIFDPEISEPAGECGLRSFQILAGILGQNRLDNQVLSYEGPFGVGYLTATIDLK